MTSPSNGQLGLHAVGSDYGAMQLAVALEGAGMGIGMEGARGE